ncbi:MAG: hypothetical protein JXA52_01140 [Planctomycetes bacterium]|nr:hypothetical protein [Planctomycetota bacterium]
MENNQLKTGEQERAFTLKSLMFGLLGVLLICVYTVFNDCQLKQSLMIGNHFPPGAFFFMFLLAFVWNRLCVKLAPSLVLNTKELVVVFAMTLSACWIPGEGLYRYFLNMLIMPWHNLKNLPRWQSLGILDYIPLKLFPEGAHTLDQTIYGKFVQGMGEGDKGVSYSALWTVFQAWLPAMKLWLPLFALFSLAILAMSLVVHRQWAHHEQLSYPLASVAGSLFKRTGKNRIADIFNNRLFWWGFIPVLCIYLITYLARWYPATVPGIYLKWHMGVGIFDLFPTMRQIPDYGLNGGILFFCIVGITYFLSSEIGFTLGVSNIVLTIVAIQFYRIYGEPISNPNLETFRGGASIAYALILFYTGRTYYVSVLTKALGFGKPVQHEKEAVLAARIFALAFAGMVGFLAFLGLDWLIALVYVGFMMLFFLIFSRIVCETGIPFLKPEWWPAIVLTKIFGPSAIGGGPLVFIYYLAQIFTQDPRECMIPYIATSLKVADDAQVKIVRMLRWVFVGLLIALIVGFGAMFVASYTQGTANLGRGSYPYKSAPSRFLKRAATEVQFLQDSGQLEASNAASGLEKLSRISVDPVSMKYLIIGLLVFGAMSIFRFRISKWPIHPLILIIWGTYSMRYMWASFLIGWGVKELVVHFAGGKAYQNFKPIFIGLIMGELVAAGIMFLVATIYYFATGIVPLNQVLNVLPL